MVENLKKYLPTLLVFVSGMAALSWESVWQLKSSLALGASAWGTAVTLAVAMGGMALGSILAGILLRKQQPQNPFRLYAVLELIIGLSGLLLIPAFALVESWDTYIYRNAYFPVSVFHPSSLALVLGIPAMAMGATLPVLGLMAQNQNVSIAKFYGLNTLGAALGILICAFLLIPALGIQASAYAIGALNIAVAICAWFMKPNQNIAVKPEVAMTITVKASSTLPFLLCALLAFATGYVTFTLEVAWFRSFISAFKSTSEAFSVMLSCVLLALGAGAYFTPLFKRKANALPAIIAWSGIFILLATPLIERFDLFVGHTDPIPGMVFIKWYGLTLYTIGLPVFLLGISLPWILDEQSTTHRWSILYSLNALGAVVGSITAAWFLLPMLGFARTAWISGSILCILGLIIILTRKDKKGGIIFGASVIALTAAIFFESGVGRDRAQGMRYHSDSHELLDFYEGPDATISVVKMENGRKELYINGFSTTSEDGRVKDIGIDYMRWMGHAPMLMHPDPKQALVICFGTGQTANAVRRENPNALDVVDINAGVFKMARHFSSNEDVLDDERVTPIVMDGRAYIRRTEKTYDVITLEPMPPTFAGVNALYSKEFYEDARAKMSADGVIAQWLPIHLLSPYAAASITKTFREVFPNAVLWQDPGPKTGIIIGTKNDQQNIYKYFPGLGRTKIERSMSDAESLEAFYLDADQLKSYSEGGALITDNNQLLAYGKASLAYRTGQNHNAANQMLMGEIKHQGE